MSLSSPAAPQEPIWREPQRPNRVGTAIAAVFGIALGVVAVIAVALYLLSALGAGSLGVAAVAALVPFSIVILVVRWIDRWEPEPRPALLFAVLWGAGVAVSVALIFDLGIELAAQATGARPSSFLQAVVQAPIVEEAGKGFGVLLLLWFGRRWFDGPIDGVVYAATVAAGFAFTENVLYFGRVLVESGLGAPFVATFIARGLFSPFAHALFTACTGFALGLAVERTGRVGAVPFYIAGLVPAVILHALWNGGLSLASNVIAYYFTVEVPIFLLAVALVLALRARERRVTAARLTEYADAGWFTRDEVALLSSWNGRRHAMAWASAQPGAPAKRAAMRRFVRDATRLAQARQRALQHREAVGRSPDERELLRAVAADRAALVS